ncbi:hypothetical protein [Actinoplanes palleronii]|uniref:ABC transporter permease n=1 Tax=Actinoplanes palleronii TaxID=113570 RepID=A0ABQ4B0E7_9ACTN|nr:hypothetical protein [Actinoplanes palleronii]GIE64163.1 hypothetical protein Apa02nite_002710 [Actinoplanes palleronii]
MTTRPGHRAAAAGLTAIIRAEVGKVVTLPALRITALLTWAGALLLIPAHADGRQVLQFAQAGFLVLGVFATTHEYQAGGQIRTTLLAVPRRLLLVAAKVAALTAVVVPVAGVVAFTAMAPGGDAARVPAMSAYLTLTTLLAAAVGLTLRHTLPAVTVMLSTYLIASPALRARLPDDAAAWLPDTALVDPPHGTVTLLLWAAATSALATTTLHLRDA